MTILNLLPYVKETRRFGVTYVHSAVRSAVSGWDGLCGTLDGRPVRVTYCGWGRSLQTARGHKYKAHLRYVDADKPVPTKLIDRVQAAPLCAYCSGSPMPHHQMVGCTCGMSDAEFNAMWSAIAD
jgi:hypothetical protein